MRHILHGNSVGTRFIASRFIASMWFVVLSFGAMIGCTLDYTPPPPTDDIRLFLPTRVVLPIYTPVATATASPTATVSPTPTATATSTPELLVEVVIISQALPAGVAIPPEALRVIQVPQSSLPYSALTDMTRIVNWVTRTPLGCYEPVVADVLARREIGTGFLTFTDCPPLPPLEIPVQMSNMVVATMYLPSGTRILPNMVVLRQYPQALLPEGAITTLSDAVGQVTAQEVFREQPITAMRLVP